MIIVDSGCDYCAQTRESADFDRVPLSLTVGDEGFIDDDALDLEGYLSAMEDSPSAVKTAAPSPSVFLEKFRKDGEAFVITLSSKLSASYNNALLAKELYLEEARGKFIHVIDSLSATCGQALVALKVKEYTSRGVGAIDIAQKIGGFVDGLKTYFVLEKYDNLVKGGRISPLIAKVADVLNIKLICFGNKGEIAMADRRRGTKRALTRLAEIIEETVSREQIDAADRILAVSHAKCADRARALADDIMRRVKFKKALIMEMSGVTATYAERGGITAAF